VVFADDGSFIPAVVSPTATARQLCDGQTVPELADKLASLNDPGLFLRKQMRDQLFHADDVPLDLFYDPLTGSKLAGTFLCCESGLKI
jgi:hypothetical protein